MTPKPQIGVMGWVRGEKHLLAGGMQLKFLMKARDERNLVKFSPVKHCQNFSQHGHTSGQSMLCVCVFVIVVTVTLKNSKTE